MIKSKDGAVEVKGSTTVLMTDLSMIIKLLRKTFEEEDIPKETGDKLIRKAVDVGFWTEDKLDKELSNMRAEVLGKLMGLALSSIWGVAEYTGWRDLYVKKIWKNWKNVFRAYSTFCYNPNIIYGILCKKREGRNNKKCRS